MKSLLFVLSIAAAACGGAGTEGGTTPKGTGSGSKPQAAGDVSLDLTPIPLKGMIFEPEALGRPGMPLYQPKNKNLKLDQQKKIFGATKDLVEKQAQAAVLATMLYQESKAKTGDDAKKLIEEARQVLRTVAAAAGKQIDEITTRLLGSYEIQLEDWGAAEKAWQQIVESKSKDAQKELLYNKAWLVHTLLKQYKNAEALAVIKGDTVSEKQPEHAYATAWVKWRAGDDAGAWQAILTAAKGWVANKNPNQDVLERDVLLFASRSKSVEFAKVMSQLFEIFGAKTPRTQYDVIAKLGLQAYQFAGRYGDAITALDEALKIGGKEVPAKQKLIIKYQQADFMVGLDQAEATSRHAKAALATLPDCKLGTGPSDCNEKEKQDVVTGIYYIARQFHLFYATSNDVRFYQPAHDLYAETIPLIKDQATRDGAKADLDKLQKQLKFTRAGTGTHEKQAMEVLLKRHNQEVLACYEETLAGNPKLAGQIVINLESDASGDIKGSSSQPPAGAADLSAVASCILANAKLWKLPKRGMAGNTRIKLTYQLAKKS